MLRYVLLLLVVVLSVIDANQPCFNVEELKKKAEESSPEKDMADQLTKTCKDKNPDDEGKAKACMRNIVETFMDVKAYKQHFLKYLIDESKRAELEKCLDECGKEKKNYFPCVAEVVSKHCPEISEFYRREIEKLGY